VTNLSLFDCETDARWSEPLGPGAFLLHGFALADDMALLEAITAISADAPFRNMVTPGGFVMSVDFRPARLPLHRSRPAHRTPVAVDACVL
jgi:alkylated DNA repair dioxygenase AlkB